MPLVLLAETRLLTRQHLFNNSERTSKNMTLTSDPELTGSQQTTDPGLRILELNGDLGSLGWSSFNDSVAEELAFENVTNPSIIVDLSEVNYGGAELLRFLMKLRKSLKAHGGEMVLCGVNDDMAEVVRLITNPG